MSSAQKILVLTGHERYQYVDEPKRTGSGVGGGALSTLMKGSEHEEEKNDTEGTDWGSRSGKHWSEAVLAGHMMGEDVTRQSTG